MRYPWAAAACLLATTVYAQPPNLEPWQEKSVETLNTFGKFKEVGWSQSISLWVFVDNDGSDWSSVGADVCKILRGNGKPDREYVSITFWDHQSALQGSGVQYGRSDCM